MYFTACIRYIVKIPRSKDDSHGNVPSVIQQRKKRRGRKRWRRVWRRRNGTEEAAERCGRGGRKNSWERGGRVGRVGGIERVMGHGSYGIALTFDLIPFQLFSRPRADPYQSYLELASTSCSTPLRVSRCTRGVVLRFFQKIPIVVSNRCAR